MKTTEESNPRIITDQTKNAPDLIPVHINKARTDKYYYTWSSDCKGWIRGEEITEKLQRLYKTPLTKSNYS